MTERVGRNDPCPCGSGKKYKSCCLLKKQQHTSSLKGRKFTAKVLSAGGQHKVSSQETLQGQQQQKKMMVDYGTLMERSFGDALQKNDDLPPLPANPSEYVAQEENKEGTEQ